ncbi:unnamed protein product [marine sediment metagenome]|uniref:Uncharacterized protein n=1 Tax=marine sediment metagenome TaxID=412755 RepID=X1BIS6_9ZZZZ
MAEVKKRARVGPHALILFDIILTKRVYSLRDIQRKKFSSYSEKKLEKELEKLLASGLIKGNIYNFHVDPLDSRVSKPSLAPRRISDSQFRFGNGKLEDKKITKSSLTTRAEKEGKRKKRLRGEYS